VLLSKLYQPSSLSRGFLPCQYTLAEALVAAFPGGELALPLNIKSARLCRPTLLTNKCSFVSLTTTVAVSRSRLRFRLNNICSSLFVETSCCCLQKPARQQSRADMRTGPQAPPEEDRVECAQVKHGQTKRSLCLVHLSVRGFDENGVMVAKVLGRSSGFDDDNQAECKACVVASRRSDLSLVLGRALLLQSWLH
jgi:hypothetical protein